MQLNGPLTDLQLSKLQQAIADLSPLQLSWVSGYLAAVSQAGAGTAPVVQAASGESARLTILFGSQTGNAEGVAKLLKEKADAAGVPADVVSMGDFKPNKLKNEKLLAIVASTHGEGEPPDDAEELHSFLVSKKAPKLADAQYAVCSLGDSSYEFFCQTGKDFDERLAKLGAQAFLPRVDCDVDYDDQAAAWADEVVAKAKELTAASAGPAIAPVAGAVAQASSQYNKKNPFTASLLTNQKITGRDSIKDIRHFEIDLEGSGLTYQPGDALGVWFENDAALVDELLALLKLDGSSQVEGKALRDLLISDYELTLSYPGFVKAYAEATGDEGLKAIADDATKLRDYLADRQIIDIIRDYPLSVTAEQLIGALRKMAPRLYSIASSQAEVDEEVHLTVGVVRYDAHGKEHLGGASGFLAERLEEGGEVKVFVEHNNNFRLPESPETPIIMVGPGTGVAPFRAFMQQREADGIEGKSWMFFGNPHFTQDFLYQVEWQGYLKSGALERMDVAWSRDQQEKVYVQHRLLEQGQEVWNWLQQGAHFYVCGDANHMAKDVHDALITIAQQHGGKSEEEAQNYLTELRKAKRYQRDVY